MTPPDSPLLRDSLRRERAHHDACRAALAAMIDGAREHVVTGADVSASGADAEVLGYQLRSKAKELGELPEGPLFFGRLDFGDGDGDGDPGGDHRGARYHLGRLRISEHPTRPPLVVDWRAPVSRAFYQASARDPQGVAVRRRFGWAPGSKGDSADLTGLEDEHLADTPEAEDIQGEPAGGAADVGGVGGVSGVGGVGGLVAREIARPRVGPMRDIAATIQPEQDDLVRAGLGVSVCVQGAPGTGKTAVGLHRAAYLLYTHPQRVRRGGLLILGPNRTFLSYISEVLPALGETGVRQSTVMDEIADPGRPVRARDDERAAVVKHDARMAEVLRRALYARVVTEGYVNSLEVPDDSYRWRISAAELARIVAGVRAEEPPYGVGRERVRTRVVARVQREAERRAGARSNGWVRRIERARPVGAYVEAVWPRVRPEEVVAGLLGDERALARAAEGLLGEEEQRAVRWTRPPRSWKSARWSAADLVLLDEVAGLIEHPGGYGHVVIDEAQDLSPMECRAIARRAPYGSLTVLGDLAQGTTPWAARSWGPLLGHLGKPDAMVIPLTTGFRVPRTVVDFANRLLARLDVPVPPARSLRGDGELRVVEATDIAGEVVAAVRRALDGEGSVGVVAAEGEVAAVREALGAAGVAVSGGRVEVMPATAVKGLEWDHVVVVEPAAIVEGEAGEAEGAAGRGLHRLYVVLTRAVSRLEVVHGRPLPF